VGAMEIVAMDMKLRGMYIARQLSFHGVGFKIEEVALSKEFVKVYDESVKLVSLDLKFFMWFQYIFCLIQDHKHLIYKGREYRTCILGWIHD
jgi:hypothetical protein